MFRGWTGKLPPTVSIVPAQPPGREIRFREPAHSSIGPLVDELMDDLAPALEEPYAFYGHSMGALVSFELARALRRAGCPLPVQLIVSGRGAPQVPTVRPWLHTLDVDALQVELRALGGTPESVLGNDDLLAALLPTLRADLALNEAYEYYDEPPLPVRITAIGGTQDDRADPAAIAAWRSQTSEMFTMRLLAAGHFFVNSQEIELLKIIEEDLAPWI
jgi:surfactin synthase thioesterase subunit